MKVWKDLGFGGFCGLSRWETFPIERDENLIKSPEVTFSTFPPTPKIPYESRESEFQLHSQRKNKIEEIQIKTFSPQFSYSLRKTGVSKPEKSKFESWLDQKFARKHKLYKMRLHLQFLANYIYNNWNHQVKMFRL